MKLYAWMVYEEDSGEWNIIVVGLPELGMALVTSQLHVAQTMTKYAEIHRERTGKPVRLVAFSPSNAFDELP